MVSINWGKKLLIQVQNQLKISYSKSIRIFSKKINLKIKDKYVQRVQKNSINFILMNQLNAKVVSMRETTTGSERIQTK